MRGEIVLAIETGIAGGSLSLLRDGSEIDFWKGVDKVSRSEDLLLNISNLLSKNSLDKSVIKKIAVSKGPGSYTGIRVGIATAKGLQKALKCECRGVSVLEAMVLKTKIPGDAISGFATGRNEVCWQAFETDGANLISSTDVSKNTLISDFAIYIKSLRNYQLICAGDLFDKISEFEIDPDNLRLIEFRENPAKYIGLRSEQTRSSAEILPVYARETRA